MAVTVNGYNQLAELIGGPFNLELDTLTLALMTSAFVFTAANTAWSDVSANELAAGNGYTSPGQNLTGLTWTTTGSTATLDANDITWNATGGPIGPADDGVLYNNSSTIPADALMLAIDFGASETAGDGTPFTVAWNVLGIIIIGPGA